MKFLSSQFRYSRAEKQSVSKFSARELCLRLDFFLLLFYYFLLLFAISRLSSERGEFKVLAIRPCFVRLLVDVSSTFVLGQRPRTLDFFSVGDGSVV